MKANIYDVGVNQRIRIFSTEREQAIGYNAAPIIEYTPYEQSLPPANTEIRWTAEEDLEIVTVWISLQPDSDTSGGVNFNVYTDNFSRIWTITISLAMLTTLGSAAFMNFPPGAVVRKGHAMGFSIGTNVNGISILTKYCHLNNSIAGSPYSPLIPE